MTRYRDCSLQLLFLQKWDRGLKTRETDSASDQTTTSEKGAGPAWDSGDDTAGEGGAASASDAGDNTVENGDAPVEEGDYASAEEADDDSAGEGKEGAGGSFLRLT